ncbi:MAG TPA: ferredoxin [Nocardioides sp.]|nr:ferredoxin [Nocardioides sp.]
MKLRVHPGRCEGHGACYFVDPDIFPLDEDGLTAVQDGTEITEAQLQAAAEGVAACPVLALDLEK